MSSTFNLLRYLFEVAVIFIFILHIRLRNLPKITQSVNGREKVKT